MTCNAPHPTPSVNVVCELEDNSPNTETFDYQYNDAGTETGRTPGPPTHVHAGAERNSDGIVIENHRWGSV